ncbi:MAG: protein kinase [Pirellulales bacterium]
MVSEKLDEKAIFNAARKIDSPDARAEYLHQVCGADQNLFERVSTLLRGYEEQASFLESPPAGTAPPNIDRPITETPGTVIGPYKLLQQIGEGGMGVVFMAEQTEPIQRTVALKIIKPGMDTRQVIARFEAERQAVAMMDHPNIAKVLDAGTTESGRPYFVMELVKGVPITKYCDEKHLPLRERLELFVQVCQAVQHAHQKGIIHRDIKPNNVLVAEYDNRAVPKVIDFGVAKATAQRLTERTMFTEFGQVFGTMEYMSPEQSKFNQLDIDTRSDIYSLGVLLYELLAGSTPFEGKRLHAAAFDEMLRIIREEEPPKPSTRLSSIDTLPSVAVNRHTEPARLSKDVQGELDWIVMKALEKDRNRRYATASNFAADIERHLNDEPVEAGPPSAIYKFRKLAWRHRLVIAAASVVAIVILTGTALSTWQAFRATRAEEIANQQRKIAEESASIADEQQRLALRQRDLTLSNLYVANMSLAYQDWQDGNVNRMSDGLMAFLPKDNTPDLRGWEWYYLASLLEEDENVFHPDLGPMRDIYYSPDGKLLAVAGDRGVAIFDAKSMRLVRSLPGSSSIEWHPKEPRLATVTKQGVSGEVTIWDVETGEAVRRIEKKGPLGDMAWRPDGKALAWGAGQSFEIWWEGNERPDVQTNPRQENSLGIYSLAWSPDGTLLVLGLGFPCELLVWSAERGEFLNPIYVRIGTSADHLHWSPESGQLAIGTHDGGIYSWNVQAQEKVLHIPAAHGGSVAGLAWSPDGHRLASGAHDHLVKVWDARTQEQVNQFAGHRDGVNGVAWSPDGTSIASGSVDGTVRIWQPNQDQAALTFAGDSTLAWSPDGKKVATKIRVPPADKSERRTDEGEPYELALIYDAQTGELLKELSPRLPAGGSRLSWSPDGRYIGVASLGQDPAAPGAAHIWDAKSGILVHEMKDIHTRADYPGKECRCIAWSPDSRLFATCGVDRRVKIWEAVTAKLLQTLDGHDTTVGTVRWSPNGLRFLSADWHRHVRIWDASTWQPLWDLRHPGSGADGTYSSAWSPDSRRIAIRSGQGDLVVWELMQGQEPRQVWIVRAHTSNIRSIAWSPDGRRIASSSEDSLVKIWDAATGREMLTFDLEGWVQTVAWSPDGARLAAVDESEKAVHIWDARKALNVDWSRRQSAPQEFGETSPDSPTTTDN